jgi:hypothetical protein
VEHLSNLTREEAVELGSVIGALFGFGLDGGEGAEAGVAAAKDGAQLLSEEGVWDVLEDVPNDSAAGLVPIEHQGAVPLRDAVIRAGGFRITDWVHRPVGSGRARPGQRRGAQQHHDLENAAGEKPRNFGPVPLVVGRR